MTVHEYGHEYTNTICHIGTLMGTQVRYMNPAPIRLHMRRDGGHIHAQSFVHSWYCSWTVMHAGVAVNRSFNVRYASGAKYGIK